MSKPKLIKKTLSVDVLVLDAGTQSRVAISEFTVEEYAEVLANADGKWPFPPLDVFCDLSHSAPRHLVADGFTRTLAARRHGRASVPCIIHQGNAWDALLWSMGANQEHGLRPTQNDKRHCIELLLDSVEKITQQKIADIVGVNVRTVRRIVAERKDSGQTPEDRTMSGSNGEDSKTGDPFGEESDGRTESEGQDAHEQEQPPRPPGNGTDEPGDSSTPDKPAKDPFKTQRSKTVKTAEALVRAFDDLNELRKSRQHETTITECQALIIKAKNWR